MTDLGTVHSSLPSQTAFQISQNYSVHIFFPLKSDTKHHCLSKCHGLKRDATLFIYKTK